MYVCMYVFTIMSLNSPHHQLFNTVSEAIFTKCCFIFTELVICVSTYLKWLMPAQHTHTRHIPYT